MSAQPYPDEPTWWAQFEADEAALYAQAGVPLDWAAFRWGTRTAYDIGAGGDPDAAKAKHLRELRIALGLPLPSPPAYPLKGAFCIPDALPGIPWGDGRRIWTPAFTCYPADWQQRVLDAYAARGYTHFVYNVARPYHGDYPEPDPLDDPRRVRRDLQAIKAAGLNTVVACCDDQDGGSVTPWRSIPENADLIDFAFPMWEMNGPLGNATYNGDGTFSGRIVDCIKATISATPYSEHYLHFTAGHGSIGTPEREGWMYVASLGIKGLFSQDSGYDRAPDADPQGTAAGLLDTAQRLGTLGLKNVAFEQITLPTYQHRAGYDEAFQRAYGAKLQQLTGGALAGFMDGGPA